MIKIALLGCTGSIGRQTIDVVRQNKELKITALSCGRNWEEMLKYAKEFNCKTLGIADVQAYNSLKSNVGNDFNVYVGDTALETLACCDADIIVVAVVGMIGLRAVLAALNAGKTVALANKEALVAGGELVTSALSKGGKLLPIDSEHSAIWQVIGDRRDFKRIILTASGGPFRTYEGNLDDVTIEQAVAHPTWSMGRKISVDSATMMNKALEIIEARWLFNTTNIDYIIHPESVVHSMVEFADGSIKAQASYADMRLPIQYALFNEHIERKYTELSLPLNLSFFAPNEEKFPAPSLARNAIKEGGNASVILNAANEASVQLFLERKIKFTDIVKIVSKTLEQETIEKISCVDDVFETHKRIYSKIYC